MPWLSAPTTSALPQATSEIGLVDFFTSAVGLHILIDILGLSAAAGLFVEPAYGPVLANYGIDALRFLKPVKPGDRIKVRLTCKEKSLRAGLGYGEVRWDTTITNQHGEAVANYDVLTMVSEKAIPDS